MNLTLKTDRLLLRTPCMEDASELYELMSVPALTTYLSWEPHTAVETTKALLANLLAAQEHDKGYHWCVCENEAIVGLASLIDVKRTIRSWTLDRAELSYWIGVQYQGKGFATEACRPIIECGFTDLHFHKIIVAHAAENFESARICKKLDFTRYAHEHDAFKKNNTWHDLLWYEALVKHND
jgi:RimJ/RimL family protein N-acetyltransferase